MTQAKRQVAVIGAGYAGLAAARTLLASPCVEVTLFEASDRVGGRACTGLVSTGYNGHMQLQALVCRAAAR